MAPPRWTAPLEFANTAYMTTYFIECMNRNADLLIKITTRSKLQKKKKL